MQKRPCWECLRRRLVCDHSRPACTRCQVNGVTCPGYDDKEPLKWLTPGERTSKTRSEHRTSTDVVWRYTPAIEEKTAGNSLPQRELHRLTRITPFLGEINADECAIVENAWYCKFLRTT